MKEKAIYAHGLGSGAASSTISTIRKVLPMYDWQAIEVNEDPVSSVRIINAAILEHRPKVLMGTSLGAMYLMYADMSFCEEDAIRILCNPACDISRIIRETLGFGEKEYFVPRQDSVQHYTLNEDVCTRFENFQTGCQTTPGKGRDYAIFSIHDELIGPTGVLSNQGSCYKAGYQILIDTEGGHRLRREVIRQIKQEIIEKL